MDLEHARPLPDAEHLARAAFSPREFARFVSLPAEARLAAFYEAWTRKEALLKALGCGLGGSLDHFDVAFGPGESPRVLWSAAGADETARFRLHAFEPEPGYVGAVAIADHAGPLRQRTWRW